MGQSFLCVFQISGGLLQSQFGFIQSWNIALSVRVPGSSAQGAGLTILQLGPVLLPDPGCG